jgi:dTMP kinase
MFLSIDGCDGTGKSTQLDRLCDWLASQGNEVLVCRDPGSTPTGEAIRDILLNRTDLEINRTCEMFLYMAARAQMVSEVIRPALEAGKTVVADRFLLANVVYQGYAGGLDVEKLWSIGLEATGGLLPELTIVLDMPSDSAAARLENRPLDRMELQGESFHARVRCGFLAEAKRNPDSIAIIHADQTIEAVHNDIRQAVERFIKSK